MEANSSGIQLPLLLPLSPPTAITTTTATTTCWLELHNGSVIFLPRTAPSVARRETLSELPQSVYCILSAAHVTVCHSAIRRVDRCFLLSSLIDQRRVTTVV